MAKTTRRKNTKRKGASASGKEAAKGSPGRKYELTGLGFAAAGLLSLCGLLGFNVGFVGLYFAKVLHYLFGIGAFPFVLFILLIGWQYMSHHCGIHYSVRFFGIVLLAISLLALWHHVVIPVGKEVLPESLTQGGGIVGGGSLFFLRSFFGVDGTLIVLIAISLGSLILATRFSLSPGLIKTEEKAKNGAMAAGSMVSSTYEKVTTASGYLEDRIISTVRDKVKDSFYNQEKDTSFSSVPEQETEKHDGDIGVEDISHPSYHSEGEDVRSSEDVHKDDKAFSEPEKKQPLPSFTIEYGRQDEEKEAASVPASKTTAPSKSLMKKNPIPLPDYEEIAPIQPAAALLEKNNMPSRTSAETQKVEAGESKNTSHKPYVLPEVTEILTRHPKKRNEALEIEIEENAHILQKTLEDFHVKAKIINACHGPAVTRYELEPAPGVKVSKITNLADDIALSLAASAVRIEPIPGKAAIGIEVPNKELEGVQLCEVLETDAFAKAKSRLTVGLGIDIGGQAVCADLAKMPHLLVAGATGSGKSVCINTLITSILFHATPDEVKFILVDPKMVELSNYNGIPHLMVPVVTEAKKAASVLNWSVQEMEKRYAKFAECNVRNMETYNKKFPDDVMPAIVIIIDELADLMMVAPHDVEDAICRLAQKARAAGIHMVLATQRPSVDVITGIIKANIPSRISFAVSSQIDSRTILDRSGAEKLLGKGDMLFFPVGFSKPLRVQGAFISDEEVEHLLAFIRSQGQEMEANEEIIAFTENAMKEEALKEEGGGANKVKQDELLPDAVELVMTTGQASTSSVQRRFRVGYTRAARLIDEMEAMGIVGPSSGSKPREILMSSEAAQAALAAYQSM